MAFDVRALRDGEWAPREATLDLPGLWRLFTSGEPEIAAALDALESAESFPVSVTVDGQESSVANKAAADRLRYALALDRLGTRWRVRGLTDWELQECQENVTGRRNRIAEAFTEALTGQPGGDPMEQYGMDDSMPGAAALRLEHVVKGSVDPKIVYHDARQMADAFPVELRMIAQKIVELSGIGGIDKKKSMPSGATPASS